MFRFTIRDWLVSAALLVSAIVLPFAFLVGGMVFGIAVLTFFLWLVGAESAGMLGINLVSYLYAIAGWVVAWYAVLSWFFRFLKTRLP